MRLFFAAQFRVIARQRLLCRAQTHGKDAPHSSAFFPVVFYAPLLKYFHFLLLFSGLRNIASASIFDAIFPCDHKMHHVELRCKKKIESKDAATITTTGGSPQRQRLVLDPCLQQRFRARDASPLN
jgi:hypothetical protein